MLLTEEVTGRDEATVRLRRRRAGFPAGKTFAGWDEARCSIPQPTQQALRTLEWVDRRENLCVCGPSGTGKSHFCEALGQLAIDTGRTVAWFGIDELGALVRRHRADDTVTRAMSDHARRPDRGRRHRHAAGRPRRRRGVLPAGGCRLRATGLAVSSNPHPAGFDELMPKTLATATVDRLLHHAHVCVTQGESSGSPKPPLARG